MKNKSLVVILLFAGNLLFAQEKVFVRPDAIDKSKNINSIGIVQQQHSITLIEQFKSNIKNYDTIISFISPLQNEINVPRNTSVQVTFYNPIDSSSISDTSIFILGDKTGYYNFFHTMIYDTSNNCVGFVLVPTKEFKIGESVSIILTNKIIFEDTSASIKFTWNFTIETKNGTANFTKPEQY